MSEFARFADQEAMLLSTCCGAALSTVSLDTVRGRLTLTECSRCERRRWSRNGKPVPISELVRHAAVTPTRHLVLLPAISKAA
jgi:hypothetical protein